MDFDKAQAVTARVHAAKPSPEPQYGIVMRPELYKQIVNYWGDFADYLHSIDAEPECIGDVYVLEGYTFPFGTEVIHDAVIKE